jgi:ribosomal protein S18 acetylase RimI-like enzyme
LTNQLRYETSPLASDSELNDLFASAWPNHIERPFQNVLNQSLAYVCAYSGNKLVGFVNIAWDGGKHGFILDATVRKAFQRTGIGAELLRLAANVAASHGLEWLHVDFEPHLEGFYQLTGFRKTNAGLLQLEGQLNSDAL